MPDECPVTRFALLRHARTLWNTMGRIQGQSNSPLTPEGRNCAMEWGHILKKYDWNRIITSDTGRATETADLINLSLNIPVSYDARLREQDWGSWTGKTLEQIEKEEPQLLMEQESAGWKFHPPHGEDRANVLKRSSEALRDADKKWPGETILLVTHEGVIKCLISRLREKEVQSIRHITFQPSHIHWLASTGGELCLEEMNALSLP